MSFGVVLAGPKAGQADVDWSPVARAMGFNQETFKARVLAAMPVLVRRELDEAVAVQVAAKLARIGAIADVVPDHGPVVYIERDGASLGPIPQAALERFIVQGDRYRLRNSRQWQVWQLGDDSAVDEVAAAIEGDVHFEPEPHGDAGQDAGEFPDAWSQPPFPADAALDASPAPSPMRSPTAGVAGYLGLLCIVPGVGLLAMFVGMLALRDLRRHPERTGLGRARFAIAMGAVLSIAWAAIFVLRDELALSGASQVNGVVAGQLVTDRQALPRPRPVERAAATVVAPVTPAVALPAKAASASTGTQATAVVPTSPQASTTRSSAPASTSSVIAQAHPAAPVHEDAPGAAVEASGPSFDCKKSLSMTETVICASKALSALDREQAAAYARALAQASGERAVSLREGQASWQRERNDLCGGDAKCIERYMRARVATFAPPAKAASPATP